MDLDKNWFRGGVAMDVYKDLRRKETELTTFGDYKGSKHLVDLFSYCMNFK